MLTTLLFAAAATAQTLGDGFVRAPGGRAVHESCVHRLPEQGLHLAHEGSELVARRGPGGREVMRMPECGRTSPGPLHGPAWKAWTVFDAAAAASDNGTTVSRLTSTWKVPGPPQNYQGEITYFWNGVEPEQESAVLQPVLQYGETPAGGGQFWGVASWYVSGTHGTAVSPLVKVEVGQEVVGDNRRLANGSWAVTGAGSSLTYEPASNDYTRAYHVLEEYDIVTCQCYPPAGQVTFYNVSVEAGGRPVRPAWQTMTKDTTCGEHATVTSPEEVVIHTTTTTRQ